MCRKHRRSPQLGIQTIHLILQTHDIIAQVNILLAQVGDERLREVVVVCFFFEGFNVAFFSVAEGALGGTVLGGAFGGRELATRNGRGGVLRGCGGGVFGCVGGDGGGCGEGWGIGGGLSCCCGIGVESKNGLRTSSVKIVLLRESVAIGKNYVFVNVAGSARCGTLLCRERLLSLLWLLRGLLLRVGIVLQDTGLSLLRASPSAIRMRTLVLTSGISSGIVESLSVHFPYKFEWKNGSADSMYET